MKNIFFVILTLILSSFLHSAETHHTYQFETIDINDGLSLNSIMTIVKDARGFMWFGTEDGLNRFDGTQFKHFRHNPMDSSSLNSSSILSTMVDSRGDLWIGTFVSGLNKYVYETESFVHYRHDPLDSLTLGEGSIWGLHEDHQGNFWIGTSGAGLFRLNPLNGQSTPVADLITNDESLADTVVYGLFEDHNHKLWISTLGGLSVLNLDTYELQTYRNDENDPNSLFDNNVNHVYESFDGENFKIWVGTNWGGLDQYDPESDSFIHHGFESSINPQYPETSVNWMIQESENRIWVGTDSKGILILDAQGKLVETIGRKVYDETALNDDVIQNLYDDGDIIWVGTSGGGVGKYTRNRKKFYSITYDPLNPEGLHDNRILRIKGDSKGNLWIATWSEGVTYYNPTTREFKMYRHDPDDPGSLSDDGIQEILVDQNDNLWLVSSSTSLDVLRSGSDKFEHIAVDLDDPDGLHSGYIMAMYEDRSGIIWLGTWNDGLIRLDPTTMKFQTYTEPSIKDISLGDLSFYTMFEDASGMLWMGVENEGLIAFDRETLTLKQYKSSPGDPYTIPHNDVMCFHEDDDGHIWLGTYGGGLSQFNPKKNTFENYSTDLGLPSTSIYAIFEDDEGYLWMSTNNGLTQFNPKQKKFKNYSISDGVLSKEFNPAGCQLDNGWMYFGGVRGITYFNPSEIKDNLSKPSIQFTDLSIMNVPIAVGQVFNDRVVLNQSITTIPVLNLFPNDLFFGIRFVGLDYYHPMSNNYAYFLDGFDEEWRYIGSKQTVTFTNIPPGEYTLKVRASNNDRVWNKEGISLPIIIHPHFYETWWFISSLILFFLLVAVVLYRLRTNFLVKHGKELEQHNIQLNAQIESRRKAHVKARERADYFRAVIAQSPIPMAIHNSEGCITHLNAGWVELWEAESPEAIISDYQVNEDHLAQQLDLGKSFARAMDGMIIEIPEVKFVGDDGLTRVVQMLLYPLKNKVGMINQVMISLEDVTQIVRQRNLLEKSINEKDLLLKEVHHRVKNNLQIVASLLGLQQAGIKDPKTAQTLEDFRNRINSMALVHDALYRSPELDNVDISRYVEELTKTLFAAFRQKDAPVNIKTDVPEIDLSVDVAVPCGLMINELVTNALKYAFPDPTMTNKQILIRFTEYDDDCLRMEVLDNGVGFQHPVVWDSVKSLGLYLVKILCENQLMGSVRVKSKRGAHFIIEFPLHPNYDD